MSTKKDNTQETQGLTREELKAAAESLLFAASKPLEIEEILEALPVGDDREMENILKALRRDYASPERGIHLEKVAGGYRLVTKARYDEYIGELYQKRGTGRLSKAALEVLAIVAYEQPVTTPEIEEIRGVNCGGVIRTLLDKKLIKISGRKQVVGKPFIYRTTDEFLIHFGLNELMDLPSIEEFDELLGNEDKGPTLFEDEDEESLGFMESEETEESDGTEAE